ncbi:MAG: hypothetical protein PHD50_03455 [Bacilli bacterium]|nr:hypothetical protein [Bacilli bacterium]
MKKKSLSILLLTASLLAAGCSSSDVSPVVEDGKYVLFSINGTNYYADDILGTNSNKFDLSFLDTVAGIKATYTEIENAIIQAAMPVTTTIQNSADLAYETWEDSVESLATEYSISIREARAYQLESEGYETVDEKKAALLLAEQKTALEKSYKKNKIEPSLTSLSGDTPLEKYVTNAVPMIVNHILVTISDSSDIYTKAAITSDEADKLGTICNRLALSKKSSNKFSLVAYDSDDGSYTYGGALGIMDTYTSYVSEFKLGVYVAETALNKDIANYRYAALGIDSGVEDALFGNDGVYANYNVNKVSVNEVCSALVSQSTDKGEQSSSTTEDVQKYPRNILFNKYFNTPAVQFLTYTDGASETAYPLSDRSVNSQGIVTDEAGNPIIVARSTYGIHFITVSYSSLDNQELDNVKYFSYLSSSSDIDSTNNYVKSTVDIGYDTLSDAQDARKKAVETKVLNYLQGGFVSISSNSDFLSYEMFKTYLNSTGIEIPNEKIKNSVLGYIENRYSGLNETIVAYENSNWYDYINKLTYDSSMRAEIYK